jgi:glycine/D-amino acid oxidase-like deaminating enzyme
MVNKEVDYLIVGQGLAGCMLAHFLEKENNSFIIIDELKGETSSTKASGLINPITGRRFVKSWKIDELIPFAEKTYKELENKFSVKLISKTKVHRIIQSIEQQNDWATKTKADRYKEYLQNTESIHHSQGIIHNPLGCIEIEPVYKVNTTLLISKFTEHFENKNLVIRKKFDYDKLQVLNKGFKYEEVLAKKVIFAEGHLAINNPYFKYLPFLLSKGEVLVFEAKDLSNDYIIGGSTNITPLGDHLFSVGATYAWDDIDLTPTKQKKQELIDKLAKIINCEYKIVSQKAGVRPTVKDRRPLLGSHPENDNLHIFNGMGTKGLSLAPYFANYFIQQVENNLAIDLEISIKRFN